MRVCGLLATCCVVLVTVARSQDDSARPLPPVDLSVSGAYVFSDKVRGKCASSSNCSISAVSPLLFFLNFLFWCV